MKNIIDLDSCTKEELLYHSKYLETMINKVMGYIEEHIDRYQLFVDKRVLLKIRDLLNIDEDDYFS